jgi:hypothetical protein
VGGGWSGRVGGPAHLTPLEPRPVVYVSIRRTAFDKLAAARAQSAFTLGGARDPPETSPGAPFPFPSSRLSHPRHLDVCSIARVCVHVRRGDSRKERVGRNSTPMFRKTL